MLMYFFFAGFLKISPCVWPNSGFWCCVFLTLGVTLVLIGIIYFIFGRKITKSWHTCLFFSKRSRQISDLFSFGERVDTGLCTGHCCCNVPVHNCRKLSPNLSRDARDCCYTTKLSKETLDLSLYWARLGNSLHNILVVIRIE